MKRIKTYFKLRLQWEGIQAHKLWEACQSTGHSASRPHPLILTCFHTIRWLITGKAWLLIFCLTLTGCKHIPIPGVDQHENNHKIIQTYPK